MKHIITFFSLLAFTMPAIANYSEYGYGDEYDMPSESYEYVAPTASTSDNARRDTYVGLRLHKNEHIEMGFHMRHGGNTTITDDSGGIGLYVGNKLTEYVKIEFETAYTGSKNSKYDTTFEYDIWANMLNVYMFYEFGNAVAPYAGVGMGMTGIWGNVGGTSDSEFDLSYQMMVGVNFALNARIDLNVGFKYQNYGGIEHKFSNGTYAKTTIDATELYIGAAYKFGLK